MPMSAAPITGAEAEQCLNTEPALLERIFVEDGVSGNEEVQQEAALLRISNANVATA